MKFVTAVTFIPVTVTAFRYSIDHVDIVTPVTKNQHH